MDNLSKYIFHLISEMNRGDQIVTVDFFFQIFMSLGHILKKIVKEYVQS